jgi:repressor LexA
MTQASIRPTKKQREILEYVDAFIKEHGYSPSYREIMSGLNYTSVATVSLHVNSLIKRGHLIKRDHSARSLEVISVTETKKVATNEIKPGQEKWLVEKVDYFFKQVEQVAKPEAGQVDELYVLIGCLKVLGLDGAVQSFLPRLSIIRKKV